ncbi:MAG: glycosyltransferase [Pseudomonadota bacterium]
MKIDLHLHSKFSKRPSQWILQKIGCPESFSEPEKLNRLRLRQGMNAFTLTDHNTINGALEIAHIDNAFISEEVTTYFPDDGCKAHVLVYNINEAIHEDLQKVRKDIFELTAYLNQNRFVHVLAHPLYAVNDRLTTRHFEQFLVLFRVFELNGARDDWSNQVLRAILESLTAKDIEHLADKHGLEPMFEKPWKKSFTGGSDDHSALNVARAYTEVPGAKTVEEFLAAVREGKSLARGKGSTPETLAHNLYGIAYQFYNSHFNLTKYANQDVLMRFLDRLLQPEPQSPGWLPVRLFHFFDSRRKRQIAASDKVEDVIRRVGEKTINSDPQLARIIRGGYSGGGNQEERWFSFVDQVCNKVMDKFGTDLFGQLSGANVFSVFGSIGAAGSLYTLLAPYFLSFSLFGRGRHLVRTLRDELDLAQRPALRNESHTKVAHFSDTFYEINGVAWTLRQQAEAAARAGKDLAIITCAAGDVPEIKGLVKNFKPINVFELPEYPEQKIFIPPFLEMVRYIYEGGFNYIHSATPGPIGLCALAAARLLKLPISGTYHTAIPEYAKHLTGDDSIEQMVWRYTLWYYDQMDLVYVPSHDTGAGLTAKGLDPAKILLYPRGVDTSAFNPRFRNGYYERNWGLGDKTKLLYVGRVSKEKNMPLLARAFKRLSRQNPNLHLIIVGDGPFRADMEADLAGWPCTFTGYLTGSDLSEAFASADLFVFPSTTDTFGNVILEAQSSGLPVVVSDAGGPRENIQPGKTGLVVPGDDLDALVDAVRTLTSNPLRLKQMSKDARAGMESRSFEKVFLEHWKLYTREQEDSPLAATRRAG